MQLALLAIVAGLGNHAPLVAARPKRLPGKCEPKGIVGVWAGRGSVPAFDYAKGGLVPEAAGQAPVVSYRPGRLFRCGPQKQEQLTTDESAWAGSLGSGRMGSQFSEVPLPTKNPEGPKRCPLFSTNLAIRSMLNTNMRRFLLPILLACSCGMPFAAGQSIYVGQPKIYDDYYLQSALDSAKAQLGLLKPLDQATLLKQIGAVQGADLRQLSVAVQAGTQPTPQVVTTTPVADAVAGGLIKDANGLPVSQSVTTQNSASPTIPTPTPPALTVPSTLTMGGLDTLNEQMQLNSEIISLQLLLDGAVSDRVGTSNGKFKKRVTIGVPITIDPGNGSSTRNKAVEVEMMVCDASHAPPSIVTLLPKERTYNVASLVDKSWLLGAGGLIGGVLSVGGSVMWGHKQFYLVQQQDSVALEKDPSTFTGGCGRDHAVAFAWQFRPVLGQKLVRAGMRQVFVQLAYEDSGSDSVPPVSVRAAWKEYDMKAGAVGAGDPHDVPIAQLENPKVALNLRTVRVKDIGQGNVQVRGSGDFMPGVRIRVGSATPDGSVLVINDHAFEFVASAKALITQRAFLVGRDGRQWELARPGQVKVEDEAKTVSALITRIGPGLAEIVPESGFALTPQQSTIDGKSVKSQTLGGHTSYFTTVPETREFSKDSKLDFQIPGYKFTMTVTGKPQSVQIQKDGISVKQYSDKLSRVEITLSSNSGSSGLPAGTTDVSEDGDAFNKDDSPLVAVIGDRIFGLQDSPYLPDSTDTKKIFLAPTDLLNAYKEVIVERILWGEQYRDRQQLKNGGPTTFAKPSLVRGGDKVTLAVRGTEIPATICAIWPNITDAPVNRVTDNLVLITIDKKIMADLKQIALGTTNGSNCDGSSLTAVLDIPEDAKPKPEKPKLTDQTVSLKPGDKTIAVQGSLLGKIETIHAGDTKLTFRLTAKEDAVAVDLGDLAKQEGVFYLTIQYDDKTTDRYKVTVKDGKAIAK